MRLRLRLIAAGGLVLCAMVASAASKPHVVMFGKTTNVKIFAGPDEDKPLELKVRSLYVDGKLKEYTFGAAHEITDRLYVVRRIVRINDTLPEETAPRWTWQRGGWLIVDRVSGHASLVNLPDFDPDSSTGTWFRDYVAYCGLSDDGRRIVAVVAQLGHRKPLLKKPLGEVNTNASDAWCPVPTWQRHPMRVIFVQTSGEKFNYEIHRRSVEAVTDDDDDSE